MMADRKKVEPLLRTARGQIDGVLKMIEDNRYCIDIMMQLQAVETGDQNEREQKIAEIIKLLDKA